MIGALYVNGLKSHDVDVRAGRPYTRTVGHPYWIAAGTATMAEFIAAVRRNGYRYQSACPRRISPPK